MTDAIGLRPQNNPDKNVNIQESSQSKQSRQRNILVEILNEEKFEENGLLSVVSEHASNAEASSLSYARSI